MAFAILRTAKLKSMGAIGASLSHTFRTRDTPNADAARTPDNSHEGGQSPAEVKAAIEARLPAKFRKDAVRTIEYLVTGSPEAMAGMSRQQQDAYFADAAGWLRERHGAANVVYTGVHRDETTPHLVAYVVPLDADTGRLNAKKWLGGKQALSAMQTDFAERVGQRHGLQRGLEGSRAVHQTIRQFYGAIDATAQQEPIQAASLAPQLDPNPKVLEKGLFTKRVEDPDAVRARISSAALGEISKAQRTASALQAEKRQWEGEKRRLTAALKQVRDQFGELIDLAKKLTPTQLGQILGAMRKTVEQNVAQQRAERAQSRGKGIGR